MFLTLPVRDVRPATPRSRIVRIDLERHPFDYLAGQAVRIGARELPKHGPYSLAASPEDARRDGWLELIVGDDDTSPSVRQPAFEPGAWLDVEGPVGTFTFPPSPAERRLLFIAGGSGIAPLRAMLQQAVRLPQAEIGLVYSARTPAEFAYGGELRSLAREGRIELIQTVTRSADASWTGRRGRIGRAVLESLVRDPETLCLVCGPPSLVEDAREWLEQLGITRQRIRHEG